ncbi:hypothetical protein Ntsu_80910 [Nocardia sp. IFM 10818]
MDRNGIRAPGRRVGTGSAALLRLSVTISTEPDPVMRAIRPAIEGASVHTHPAPCLAVAAFSCA